MDVIVNVKLRLNKWTRVIVAKHQVETESVSETGSETEIELERRRSKTKLNRR